MKTENTLTVEIKQSGFELVTKSGQIILTSEPANKGKLHRWLTKNGYKPSGVIADEWVKI